MSNPLVAELRRSASLEILQTCGTAAQVAANYIPTAVNILESTDGQRPLEITKILRGTKLEVCDRLNLGRTTQERVPGLTAVEQHTRLMLVGKGGAGKTQFLHYLATQCAEGKFQPQRVPILIQLRHFATATEQSEQSEQPELLSYIAQSFGAFGVENAAAKVAELLDQGEALLLLDGLDEVSDRAFAHVLTQIHNLSNRAISSCIVIACNIGARDRFLDGFTITEVVEFKASDIAKFVHAWFKSENLAKAQRFVQLLESNKPARRLSTNPLMLKLLCQVFQENTILPTDRCELCAGFIHNLLKQPRKIKTGISLQRQMDLLSHLAFIYYAQDRDWISHNELQQHIQHYTTYLFEPVLEQSPNPNPIINEKLLIDLLTTEHGLLSKHEEAEAYEFSHLFFQQYLVAREIVALSEPQAVEDTLKQLVSRVSDRKWRDIFLMVVSMMRNADYFLLLMKQQIDRIVAVDPKLQQFLEWLDQKSQMVGAGHDTAVVRAYYFDRVLELNFDNALSGAINDAMDVNLDRTLELAQELLRTLATLQDPELMHNRSFTSSFEMNQALASERSRILERAIGIGSGLERSLDLAIALAAEPELELEEEQSLQWMKEQIPNPSGDREEFAKWWELDGKVWTNYLRDFIAQLHDLRRDWQFNDPQREALQKYYDANKLLAACLTSDCCVSLAVREEIRTTMLVLGA
jgi:predicted NACHT family NTPase